MVRLKNIRIRNKTVICDIIPEDSQTAGFIEVDLVEQKVSNFSLPVGYEWCESHIKHAESYILKTLKEKNILPLEKTIMWY